MKSNITIANSLSSELEEKLTRLVKSLDDGSYGNLEHTSKFSREIDWVARDILASSEIGIWCLNEQTKQLHFSKNWEEFLGYSKEEVEKFSIESLAKLIHPQDECKFSVFLSEIQNRRIEKEKYDFFMRIQHKNKGWGYILIRGKVTIRDSNGIPKWSFGTYVDFIECMQSEIEKQDFYLMQNLHHNLPGFVYEYYITPEKLRYFPYMSGNVKDIFGLTPEDGLNHPEKFFNMMHSEDLGEVQNSIEKALEGLTNWSTAYRIIHPTNGIRWIETHATLHKRENGAISAYGYAYDATEARKVKEYAHLATKIYENTKDGVMVVDHDGIINKINPAITFITGYTEKELVGKSATILSSGKHNQSFYKNMAESIYKDGYFQGEIISKKKNGEAYTSLLTVEAIPDSTNSKLKNYIATFTDISELKERQDELVRLESYDHLTNLPNRRLLLEKLEQALEEAQNNDKKVVVCFIDLDDFKPINDTYGHSFGDRFLCHLAEELVSSVRQQDTVARLGGDEFVVVLKNIKDEVELNNLIDNLNSACTKTYEVLSEKITLSASIGVVIYPNVKGDADELIRFADQSMYKAKQQGRKRCVFFDSQKEDASIAHYLKLEQVRAALENDEFTLWYQPKVDVATNKVLGVEALIRWQKPDGKIIPAFEFINIIEGDPLDYQIGKFVIERALKDQSRWRKKGFEIAVSVNISSDHLLHANFEDDLKEFINKYNSNPKLIIIEILETSQISDFDVVIERLKSCLKLGVCFSLDDFGTGYSSLGYLRALPTQEVKIDKSFIFSMLKESQDKMIVQGIIDLSHALGRVVVAEGVETDAHVSELKKMGADLIQGYGVSKPMPEEKLLPWIESWEGHI